MHTIWKAHLALVCGASLLLVSSGCKAWRESPRWPFPAQSASGVAANATAASGVSSAESPDAPKKKKEGSVKLASFQNMVQPKKQKPSQAEEIEFETPASIAAIWVDSVLTQPGKEAIRGFGGRFFFYGEAGTPVRVDGELVIYAFDDSNELTAQKVPDRKYVFRAEELQTHHTESELGPSYNFWIPWGPVGGPRQTIALLPMLKLADGRTIPGEQSLNILPGKNPSADSRELPRIQRVARGKTRIRSEFGPRDDTEGNGDWQRPLTPEDYNRTRIRATTIKVPSQLAEQMSQLPPQSSSNGKSSASSQAETQYVDESGRRLSASEMLSQPLQRTGTGQPNASSRRSDGYSTPADSRTSGKESQPSGAFGVPGRIPNRGR